MTRGDFVVVGDGARRVRAMVGLASNNGRSVLLFFDGLLDGCAGVLPLLRDDGGAYRNIATGHELIIACGAYRPDHNGECLNCDERLDAHEPGDDDP